MDRERLINVYCVTVRQEQDILLREVDVSLWIDPWSLGEMPETRAITLVQKQKYSKAEVVFRSALLLGEGKARESEIHPAAMGRLIR